MPTSYDTIGLTYSDLRKPDARIAVMISDALGSVETVLNVGAGTGSYEPTDRSVTAIEPSIEMIRQRTAASAPVVQGFAEGLPFADNAFDAAMAILTVHHWADKAQGLRELRRVARGPVVILTYDPAHRGFWLADYIPELVTLDDAQMPKMTAYASCLGKVRITPVPIPHDCTDGFLCAYWRRPSAFLDPKVRAAISSFWAIDKNKVSDGLTRLAHDLETGVWTERYADLMDVDARDFGYRLVTTSS